MNRIILELMTRFQQRPRVAWGRDFNSHRPWRCIFRNWFRFGSLSKILLFISFTSYRVHVLVRFSLMHRSSVATTEQTEIVRWTVVYTITITITITITNTITNTNTNVSLCNNVEWVYILFIFIFYFINFCMLKFYE